MTQLKVHGTPEQFEQMSKMSQLHEELLALTLAKRIAGMQPEQSIEFILSWFNTVRHMAQATWMTSGITVEVDGQMLLSQAPRAVTKGQMFKLMDVVIPLIEKEAKTKLTDEAKETVYHKLAEALK